MHDAHTHTHKHTHTDTLITDFPFFLKFLHCTLITFLVDNSIFIFPLCVDSVHHFSTSNLPHYFWPDCLIFLFVPFWKCVSLVNSLVPVCVWLHWGLLMWRLLKPVYIWVSYPYMGLCVWLYVVCVCVCVCLAPCTLYILGVCPAHPVCMVRLQPNGGGQSKMPGSFLLPPPPPVARPVPLPMPDSKIISTPTDGGLTSPASPCKSPPTPTPLHKPHYCPSLPTDYS